MRGQWIDGKIEVRNKVGLMILEIRTISRNGRMIYLKKMGRDAVRLLPLTSDSFEMLQTR